MKSSMTVDELYKILGELPRGMRINIVGGDGPRQSVHSVGPLWIDEDGEGADEAYGVLYLGTGRQLGYLPGDVQPSFTGSHRA
jgi:hypothetical protein